MTRLLALFALLLLLAFLAVGYPVGNADPATLPPPSITTAETSNVKMLRGLRVDN